MFRPAPMASAIKAAPECAWYEGALGGLCMFRFAVLVLALLSLSGSSAFAQGLASLRGTVTDASGAVVPSATVTVEQTGTRLTRAVHTDAQGDYLIPSLPPAGYVLTVHVAGFRQATQNGI